MTIDRAVLLTALEKAMPGVDSNSLLLAGADAFIFGQKHICTYNDAICVTVPFEVEGDTQLEGAVKAVEFYKVLSKFAGDLVNLDVSPGAWKLTSGRTVVEMKLLQNDMGEKIAQVINSRGAWLPLPLDFKEGLKATAFGSNKSKLSGTFFNEDTIYSTDEVRINAFKSDKAAFPRFWIAERSSKELAKILGLSELSLATAWAHFKALDGTIFSCKRLNDGEFPLKSIIRLLGEFTQPATEDFQGQLPAELSEAVARAASFSMAVESANTVRLTFMTDGVEVYSKRDSGKFKEMVPWGDVAPDHEVDPLEVYVDFTMVEYALRMSNKFHVRQQELKAGEIKKRMVFTGEKQILLLGTIIPSDDKPAA